MHGGNIYETKISYDFSVNINPLGINANVKNAVLNAVNNIEHYPELESNKLCKKIAEVFGLNKNNVVCGNGASELISTVFQAVKPSDVVLASPSFSGYEVAASSFNSRIHYFNLDEKKDFNIDLSDAEHLFKQLEESNANMLILANPNNPNGSLIVKDVISKIADYCEDKKIIFLIDECFIELTEDPKSFSFLDRISEYNYVLVLRAFTKSFAMPGIRLGYCIGNEKLISDIKAKLPEWNVSVLAQEAGIAALDNISYVSEANELIMRERKFLHNKLESFGLKVFSSQTNFILFYFDSFIDLKNELIKKEILIRDCSDYKGLKKGFYRIAVKKHEENIILIENIKKVLEENNAKN